MNYSYREWLFWEPYVVAVLSAFVLYFNWFRFDEGSQAIAVSLLNIAEYADANMYILKFFTNDILEIAKLLSIGVYTVTAVEILFIIVKALKIEKIAKVICFIGGALNFIISVSILMRYFLLIEFDGFIGMGIYIRLTFFTVFTFMMSCWQLMLSIPKPKWA